MKTTASAVMPTYSRLPVALVRGSGSWVWDHEGRQYLDALSGIAVNTLGHAHPRLVEALQKQVATLIHASNLYQAPLQEELAEALTQRSGMTNAFFCNSGLEANEAAIKLARKHGHRLGFERPEVLVFEKAFHGRSLATLSATGNKKVQIGFEPLVEGFVRAPMNDLKAVQEALDQHRLVLDLAPAFLSISPLDCEALDVLFGFDFAYRGNHNALLAEALGVGPSLDRVAELPGARVINYEPSLTMSLDEDCRVQVRVSTETRTNAFQVRTGDYADEQLSVYVTARQYGSLDADATYCETVDRLARMARDVLDSCVVEQILKPLARTIAMK